MGVLTLLYTVCSIIFAVTLVTSFLNASKDKKNMYHGETKIKLEATKTMTALRSFAMVMGLVAMVVLGYELLLSPSANYESTIQLLFWSLALIYNITNLPRFYHVTNKGLLSQGLPFMRAKFYPWHVVSEVDSQSLQKIKFSVTQPHRSHIIARMPKENGQGTIKEIEALRGAK